MISVKKIKYNDLYSNELNPGPDLICNLAFDSDDGGTDSWLNREAVASETYRGEFKRVHNYKYTDTLSPQFTFMKEDFSDFTLTEQRAVLAWLTSKNTASYLSVYYGDCNSEELAYELLGGFTEIELYKMGNGRVVGIVATFESVAPYAFSPVNSITPKYENPSNANITTIIGDRYENSLCPYDGLTITCNTDEPNSYIYPKITIDMANNWIGIKKGSFNDKGFKPDRVKNTIYRESDGTNTIYRYLNSNNEIKETPYISTLKDITTSSIIIKNKTIGTKMQIENVETEGRIIIDGANQIITTLSCQNPEDVGAKRIYIEKEHIYGDDFNWQWLPLQQGPNEISIIAHGIFKFEWREPMKVGEV